MKKNILILITTLIFSWLIDDSLISISDFKSKYPEIKELKNLEMAQSFLIILNNCLIQKKRSKFTS